MQWNEGLCPQYYEGAWSTSNSEEFNELIDTLLAEDHVQAGTSTPIAAESCG